MRWRSNAFLAKAARGDIGQLCATIQHEFRDERGVALSAAGLPAAVQDLLPAGDARFLRRAKRFVFEPLSRLRRGGAAAPIQDAGRRIAARTYAMRPRPPTDTVHPDRERDHILRSELR